ncbi:hypothetical protein SAMN05444003_1610 [Cognatiyoonia sediminum]|uniref:Rieske domain-containing protein n=1 Tax=Cognatiyoonia sediminum TaxID=1508389 RepID=A0A1M5NV71_9RHOB|nr:hypothetical protein [Cognatiyoonia sediminum]SHG93400.1 hypothetical protein SAMN05444003_1610 [Cognatiyoonia sediminum]
MKTISRRHVILTLSSATITLCPALLNAQAVEFDWGEDVPTNVPRGEDQTVMLAAGETDVDISSLTAGQVAVIGRPTDDPEYSNTDGIQYVAVLRRTDAQIEQGAPEQAVADPRFFVANLVCPHRGYAVGVTDLEVAPFACTKRGSRHGSVFNAGGFGVAGRSEGDFLSVPDYQINDNGGQIILTLV